MEGETATVRSTRVSTEADAKASAANGRKAVVIAVLLLVVLLALIIVAVWLLASNPARTANIRDIVIVLSAVVLMLTNIAIAGLLIILIYRMQDLVHVLRTEVQPTLSNVAQTVRAVTGTARMVSDNVAGPTIKAAGIIAGLQQVARTTRRKVNERRER